MNDDRFDDFLRDAAQDYNEPPSIPRDEMWQRIRDARAADVKVVPLRPNVSVWMRRAVGIAAVLLVGIAIGRFSIGSSTDPDVVSTPSLGEPVDPNIAYIVL